MPDEIVFRDDFGLEFLSKVRDGNLSEVERLTELLREDEKFAELQTFSVGEAIRFGHVPILQFFLQRGAHYDPTQDPLVAFHMVNSWRSAAQTFM